MKYPNNYKIAYIAGVLTAKLTLRYGDREEIPTPIQCMRDFLHLRTVFGRYYNLLKGIDHNYKFFQEYESLLSVMPLPKKSIGDASDFMVGYGITFYHHFRLKQKLSKRDCQLYSL